MVNEDRLDGLLVQWGEARKEGRELSAEVLCQSHPELLEDLKRGIHAVTQMERFIKLDDDSDDNFLHLPDLSTISNRADETRLPESNLNLDEFCERLIDSELMDTQQVQKHRKVYPGADAVSFAGQLVAGKKLTRFQATVLLEGRDLPLVLDRYVILDEIGAGGMGAVYKALHQQMDRVVALKILPGSAVDSPDKVKRFQREVKAAAKLEHPHIVTAFDAHESKGIHFLVMSYVSGSDLSKVVRKKGPLSAAKAVNYIAQAAQGLEHAHRMGIIHRDIKPANLLLDNQGTVKILDMGLARIDNADTEHYKTVSQELTQAGMVMGTIAYLAPEQALDIRNADARSDMYALGCTLYYLLTGRPIFSEDTVMKTMLAHRECEIPSLRSDRIPEELDEVFHKMVSKKPEDRFQSMTDLILALESLDIEDDEAEESGELAVPTSQAMHQTATFIDTSRDVILTNAKSQPPRSRYWGIFVACLLGFAGLGWAWAAGILIKVETSAGTIILEIDQPELAGATVSVDDEKKLTIQTGEGKEPIEVTADDKTHTLKVVKGGFETFTKEFIVKAGKNETIKVRLEPLNTEIAAKPEPVTVAEYKWPEDQPAPAIAPFNTEQAKQRQAEWAKHLGVEVETSNSIGMKFRVIPPGEFMMGTSDEQIDEQIEEAETQKLHEWNSKSILREGPQHHVTLTKPFALAVHEVTRGQFRQFVDATNYKTTAEKDGRGGWGFIGNAWNRGPEFQWNTELGFEIQQTDEHPVVNVTWTDAIAFCEWLSQKEGVTYRLPTEAEWEFTCRAGNGGRFCFGDDATLLEDYAWFGGMLGKWNDRTGTHPVGGKKASAFGVFDLHGNVCEFCGDKYEPYGTAAVIDPSPRGDKYALRGGNYGMPASSNRSAFRNFTNAFGCSNSIGIRVARVFDNSTPPKKQPSSTPEAELKPPATPVQSHPATAITFDWPEDQPAPAIAPFSAEQARQRQEEWASHLGVEVETSNSIGMKFRLIPPGEFLMGSTEDQIAELIRESNDSSFVTYRMRIEAPQHHVTLTKPFGMGTHEVTRGQFRQFVEASGYQTDAERRGENDGKPVVYPKLTWNTELGYEASSDKKPTDDHPVANVSWNDARAFCAWLSEKEGVSYRLPTEAEWEFCCRAGSLARFSFGDDESLLDKYAWFGRKNPEKVGEKTANAWGLYDMHGNVWEWSNDFTRPYSTTAMVDPIGPWPGILVGGAVRGGTFDSLPLHLRSTNRLFIPTGRVPAFRDQKIGFRVSLSIDALKAAIGKHTETAGNGSASDVRPHELPAPAAALEALRRDQISPAALAYAGNGDPEKAPASLVAVLGEPEPIHTAGIAALAYSPDGRWLASGGIDQKILLRDTKTGKVDRVLEGHQSTIICVAFTPDSRTLVSGSGDGKVNLWSVEDEQEPTALQFNINGMQMAVSPDGRFVAAGGSDGQVKLWKWGQWDDPLDLPAAANFSLAALSFSADGERLACGWSMKDADSPIGLYRTVDGTLEETLTESNVYSLAFSPDGKSLASGRKFWDLAKKTSIDFTPSGHVCFSPDSRKIAILNHFGGHVFDVESRSEIKGSTSLSYSAYTGLYRPAFSADGRTLAIGDSGGAINFYDTDDWKQRQEFFLQGHRSCIAELTVSPDGLTVLSGGLDKALHRWRITQPLEHEIVDLNHKFESHTLAYSPDGSTYADGNWNAIVRDVATNDELFRIPYGLYDLVYSPDGKLIAALTFGDHSVRLWNVALGKEIHQFPAFNVRGHRLAFSVDGKLLAAAGVDGTLTVWNVVTGKEVASVGAEVGSLSTTSGMQSVAFHPRGDLLVTGHIDGKITFWDTSTWTKTRELSAHTGAVHGLRFTPDGRTLISSGADGTVHVRNADHDVPRAVIPVGFPASFSITFDLDASGQYLFASGPTPLIYVHRLPLEN